MKQLNFIIIFIFLFFIPYKYCLPAQLAVINTIDGKRIEGEVSSSGNLIEWRKDIYEYKNQNGVYEKFFLKPEYKGKFRLSEIKEIIKINPSSAPEKYAILEDGSQAKSIQNYRITFWNGNIFHISDFVTLSSFYIDIHGREGKKRIYISQIKSLKFTGKKSIKSIETTKDKKRGISEKSSVPELTRGKEKKILKEKTPVLSDESAVTSTKYIFSLFILLVLLIAVLVLLIILMLRYRYLYGKRIKKKKVKKIKPDRFGRKSVKKRGTIPIFPKQKKENR